MYHALSLSPSLLSLFLLRRGHLDVGTVVLDIIVERSPSPPPSYARRRPPNREHRHGRPPEGIARPAILPLIPGRSVRRFPPPGALFRGRGGGRIGGGRSHGPLSVPHAIVIDLKYGALRAGMREVGRVRLLHVGVGLEFVALVAVLVTRIVITIEPVLLLVALPVIIFREASSSALSPVPILAPVISPFRLLSIVSPAWLAYLVRIHARVPRIERTARRGCRE
mmetsp:Transcript_24757/g.59693  ORF Transcript_24757/g.59693 Transcript_24757/m.59693 type:complete len:224 (-) Transcript_24757:999-1670(-)